ncbi:hypothetical protein COU76_04940 [Candidatus Peregrinibacteria bacterium CG10_big_fil_rev_8_21_14_0_10_49_10]|nr:MAG: hypothetical protein COU76_04940 [Candidatus Peregrinibacteria bacterium CG10_big_fil_rev_8_21_14_0_10_49_10]
MRSERGQHLGKNLLLCVTSLSVFLGGSELLARVQYTPEKDDGGGIFVFDREKGFQLNANHTDVFEGKTVTTNSSGQRSPEIPVKKPKNTKRILVLGDSISFGHGMSDAEPYPRLLENTLNTSFKEQGSTTRVQVMNTAAPMNYPLQEYYDLERNLRFEPDVIILQLTLNDVYDAPAINEIPKSQYIDYVLKEYSALYLFLKDVYGRVLFTDPTGENIAEKAKQLEIVSLEKLIYEPNDPDVIAAWDKTLHWVGKITESAHKRNIPIVILVTPFVFQLDADELLASPQQQFRVFAEERSVLVIDLLGVLKILFADFVHPELTREQLTSKIITDALRTHSEKKEMFWNALFMDYDHPTAYGHELISGLLFPYMVDLLKN